MDSPFDDRDVDDPVLRDYIYLKIRNRKARDERRLRTLYFEVDPARYIFKPITREEYIVKEAEISGTPDKGAERREAKRNQSQNDRSQNSQPQTVFAAAAAANEKEEKAKRKRKSTVDIVVEMPGGINL